jgi:HK97 family phage prohead protease
MQREVRSLGEIVKRAAPAEGGVRPIGGYAAVFNSDANIGGYFVERIAPGAFANAIGRDDVRCLFNHDDHYVLGRSASGTLRLSEDDRGLAYEADPPDASWARDLVASIERGDISQSSFAFRATREEWDETGPLPIRTILEVQLFDVSPVTYPAYDDTEVGVRAKDLLLEKRGAGLLAAPARFDPSATKFRMRAGLDLRTRSSSPARR